MKVEFYFRIWIFNDENSDDIYEDEEVFVYTLDKFSTAATKSSTEWAKYSLCNEDYFQLFGLDDTKNWQIVGKAVLAGGYVGNEYDETLDIVEYQKTEVNFTVGSYMHYVEIVERAAGNVIKRLGPVTERVADRILVGVSINLNHDEYFARIVVETKDESSK